MGARSAGVELRSARGGDPDGRLLALAAGGFTLATSDGGLIDRVDRWVPLSDLALCGTGARIVDLGG